MTIMILSMQWVLEVSKLLLLLLSLKEKKSPLIISDQGGLTTHPDLKEAPLKKKILIKIQQPLIKFIINQSRKVIVANDYEKNIFLHFCNESKILVVKNGVVFLSEFFF